MASFSSALSGAPKKSFAEIVSPGSYEAKEVAGAKGEQQLAAAAASKARRDEKKAGLTRFKAQRLAMMKKELTAVKEEVRVDGLKKRRVKVIEAVKEFIWLKSIARQMINNTYAQITRNQHKSMKKNARGQCLSDEVTPDKYLRQKDDIMDFFWKRDFVIYANGDWFPFESSSPPGSPPESPTKNSRKISFGGNDENRSIDIDVSEDVSPMKLHDGPRITSARALAESIELWYREGFNKVAADEFRQQQIYNEVAADEFRQQQIYFPNSSRGAEKPQQAVPLRPYSEFWSHSTMQLYKKMGLLENFGSLIKDALTTYESGGKVVFTSSSPFRLNDPLKVNLVKMYQEYSKERAPQTSLSPHAKPFTMPI